MNIEQELLNDGIIVKEKIDTDTVLKISQNISNRIIETYPNLGFSFDDIFAKLCTVAMYRAVIPNRNG